MQFQRKGPKGWCGVASVQAALRCLRIRKSQQWLASVAHMGAGGGVVDEKEIVRMLLASGATADTVNMTALNAESWLSAHLLLWGPAILYLPSDDHYVTVIGTVGTNAVVVFDPENTRKNQRENGIRVYSWAGLRTRWRDTDDNCFGIGAWVHKSKPEV